MNTRKAAAADLPSIRHLIISLAAYEKLSHEVETSSDALRQHLFPDQGEPTAHCILAEDGAAVVGFALYFFNYSTFLGRPGLYLEDLFVEPAHRGNGHGRSLLRHLAAIARDRGCGRMEWTVLDWNQPAIDFYESLSARRMTDWTICRLDHDAIARLAGA